MFKVQISATYGRGLVNRYSSFLGLKQLEEAVERYMSSRRRGSRPRLQFERTDWNKVGQYIQSNIKMPPRIETKEEPDEVVDSLINITQRLSKLFRKAGRSWDH
jgi:hypothetical protein